MTNLQDWLARYGESHQNPLNIAIHKVCVPTIVFTVLGLAWSVPLPTELRQLVSIGGIAIVNLATLIFLGGMLFYLRLSLPMAAGMGLMCIAFLGLLGWLESTGANIFLISLGIFVAAWIGQFIGHRIEGRKPSFFEDIQFLLIGPAWTLSWLYRRLNIRY